MNSNKIHDSLDEYNSAHLHQKDKKQKGTKKKDKPTEIPYHQQVETLKLHKKSTKHEKRERQSSGDTPKRKLKDIQAFSHGPTNPDLVDVDPGASSSNSPQISGISSSSFAGGTITTQTVGKYVDQGIFMTLFSLKARVAESPIVKFTFVYHFLHLQMVERFGYARGVGSKMMAAL